MRWLFCSDALAFLPWETHKRRTATSVIMPLSLDLDNVVSVWTSRLRLGRMPSSLWTSSNRRKNAVHLQTIMPSRVAHELIHFTHHLAPKVEKATAAYKAVEKEDKELEVRRQPVKVNQP